MGFLDYFGHRELDRYQDHLNRAILRRLTNLEHRMALNDEALRDLDEQLDALEEYVLSDDETDAAEVQERVSRLKALLAAVQPAPEEPPAEPTA